MGCTILGLGCLCDTWTETQLSDILCQHSQQLEERVTQFWRGPKWNTLTFSWSSGMIGNRSYVCVLSIMFCMTSDSWLLLFSSSVVFDSMTQRVPWTVACQVPLSMGFPRQEYWSGLPFPSPGLRLLNVSAFNLHSMSATHSHGIPSILSPGSAHLTNLAGLVFLLSCRQASWRNFLNPSLSFIYHLLLSPLRYFSQDHQKCLLKKSFVYFFILIDLFAVS